MKYKIEFNYRYGKDYVMSTMKMSGSYSHLILMVYVLLQRLIYYLLENANNANAIKIGKFKIAHGD